MTTRMPPLVAMLTHSAACSGAELFIARVAAARVRVDVVVVLGEHGPLEAVLDQLGVDHEVVALDDDVRNHTAGSGGGLVRKARSTLTTTRALAGRLRALGVDVVHTHSAKAHLYGGLAGRLARIPVVAHVHDVVGGPGTSRRNAQVLRTALAVLPTGAIANSHTTARSLGRSRRRPAVIGCPVDVPSAPPAAPDRSPGSFTLGMIGRLTPWKGQDVVIRAFAAARSRGLGPDSELAVVGAAHFGADADFSNELRALVTDLGIEDAVVFRGHRSDVAAEIAACDAVVHASTRPEPFGQVVTEAMALGRPVIASAAGGPAEIITDGHDGVLVAPGDVDALADAMLRLAADPGLRARLAVGGRRTVEQFATPVVVEQIESVLLRAARRTR